MSVQQFFQHAVRGSLGDLARRDDPAADYLTGLLTRFARMEDLHPRGFRVPRIESIGEALLEIQDAWDEESAHFHPEHEVQLRHHVADYTLFMTGIFRERVEKIAGVRHYVAEGKRAYRFVAEHRRAWLGEPRAQLFRRLSDQFEAYVAVLDYARRVYFNARPDLPFFRLALG
jgi:hypothetical protein